MMLHVIIPHQIMQYLVWVNALWHMYSVTCDIFLYSCKDCNHSVHVHVVPEIIACLLPLIVGF